MHEFLILNINCPHCNNSLMDSEELIDKKPGIKLAIKAGDKTGFIYLSSVWGSYNYKSQIPLPFDMIAQFYCPLCKKEIKSNNHCSLCDAPMIPFILDMGGKVSICSRSTCKNHFVEFDDLSEALNKLYQEFEFTGKYTPEELKIIQRKQEPYVKEENKSLEILKSGIFLMSYCPNCRKSLIDHNLLKLKINTSGNSGILLLSPFMNVFTSESTIFLQEDKPVTNISCPHCDTSLISTEKTCEFCGSPVARIFVSARTKMINFYICSKKGCKWHGVSDEDLQDIKLEDSLEW